PESFVSSNPFPLILTIRALPFRGRTDSVALCPGAFGNPRRKNSESSKETIIRPRTYRDDVEFAPKVSRAANIDVVEALPTTLKKLLRFIFDSPLVCYKPEPEPGSLIVSRKICIFFINGGKSERFRNLAPFAFDRGTNPDRREPFFTSSCVR